MLMASLLRNTKLGIEVVYCDICIIGLVLPIFRSVGYMLKLIRVPWAKPR